MGVVRRRPRAPDRRPSGRARARLRGVVSIAYTVWFERPGTASLRREPLRDPGEGEVRVRALCSAVSAGAERLVLRGEVPPGMRGSFAFPLAYPAALVGTIEAAGPGVPGDRIGERALLVHPHQDVIVAPMDALVPLATGRGAPPAPRLTLAPALEVALSAVWDAAIALGDRVVVTGLGVIGLLVARLARRAGAASVLGVDPDPDRAALALALGVTEATRSTSARAVDEADVLIEASGAPAALADLLAHAGPEARIVVVSWYGREPASLPLGGPFFSRRASLVASDASSAPRRARWTRERRLALACELLEDDALDRLIAPSVPLSEASALYDELARGVVWTPPHRVLDPRR
jgi:2-desacetyl-2-hydroxyethyl bacteriochlorophyllide A dehydrogenase